MTMKGRASKKSMDTRRQSKKRKIGQKVEMQSLRKIVTIIRNKKQLGEVCFETFKHLVGRDGCLSVG